MSATASAPLICRRADGPVELNGDLSKPVWSRAVESRRFVDMVTGVPGWHDTRARCLWDDTAFYVGFTVIEPNITATQTLRDSIVFLDNDVELFIDGGDCYYELEINALGVIYEVLFVWKDAAGPRTRFDIPELDVHAMSALTFAGDSDRSGPTFWTGTHPRGPRWAFRDYDLPGLQVAVALDGTVNEPSSVDRGWTVELAIPWQSLRLLAGDRPLPPHPGDRWRMFFGRFNRIDPSGIEVQPHPAWVLDSHGSYDTHQPDRWSTVEFVD